MTSGLWSERGGPEAGPLVVLLHGLGHTAEVWRPLLDGLASGWLAVDLPAHGRSPWSERYGFDGIATEVAAVLPPGRPVLAVGHSLGGAVALALAAARSDVCGVLGFGIKVTWTDEELAAMRARASRPPKVFASPDEAVAAFLRFGGLEDLAGLDSRLGRSGVTAVEDGYQLATDPRTMAIGAPDMPTLLAGARAHARVVLACGEHDHMVSPDQLRAVDPDAVAIPGAGHNVHVTHPQLVRDLLDRLA